MDLHKVQVLLIICTTTLFRIGRKQVTASFLQGNRNHETNVRLVDQYDNDQWSEGFVLVSINGTWGTVCAFTFDRIDAEVTCLGLGFSGTVLFDYYSYKPKPDNIINDVRCFGNETSLLECRTSEIDTEGDCWAPAKAAVSCTNYTLRLTGGSFPGEGKVEVFHLGSWRPICSDQWDINGGHVACRELGLGTALYVDHSSASSKERGNDILKGIRCNGNESSILDCLEPSFSARNCISSRFAVVRCSSGVRLVGGRNSSEGRVEFFWKSTWGTACGESWTLNDAHVVCKSLGFAGALKAFTDADFGFGSGKIYLVDAGCIGRENNILDCPNAEFGATDHCIFDGAGVMCSSQEEVIYLTDGRSFLDGMVVYYYNGQQRSVCGDSWDVNDADVVCRSLGLGHAHMIPAEADVSNGRRADVILDHVFCTGNESTFFDCPGVGIVSESNCSNSQDVRVICSGGNVCITNLCDFRLSAEEVSECQSLIQRTNDSPLGTCFQSEVESVESRSLALKCLTYTEMELLGYLFGQILQCQKEIENVFLSRRNISSLERHVFSGMDNLEVLVLDFNMIENIPDRTFEGLENLEFLDLSNNRIQSLSPKVFDGIPKLKTLNLQSNKIFDIPRVTFRGLPSLKNLFLDHNNITSIPDDLLFGSLDVLWLDNNNINELQYGALRGLSAISRKLFLEHNHIRKIDNRSFDALQTRQLSLHHNSLVTVKRILHGLPELNRLNLSNNYIKYIAHDDFKYQISLTILDLSNNPITRIDSDVFTHVMSLEYIFLIDNDLQSIQEDILTGLTSLKAMSTSDSRLCCLIDHEINVTCARTSTTSPLDTCGRLYPSVVLRIAGWIIGLSSLIGNMAVLVLRFRQEQQLTVQTLLIINLAVADCLMGIYMIIITSADFHFGSSYFLSAPVWRESFLCKFSSFLAFLSSECSVFTLALMAVDRLICIKFPFSRYRLTVKSTSIILILLWLLICVLSLIPLVVPDDLPGFYGLSDVCIGLPLHAESQETGVLRFLDSRGIGGDEFTAEYIVTDSSVRPSWLYSIVTFIGVNMVLFIFILICYILMFIEVKKSSQSVGKGTLRNREITVARKMALIVGTDFACWMPIVVMGILTQSGLVVLPTSLYAWSVIFIIPINSSINPILYTFANYMEGKKKRRQNTGKRTNALRSDMKERNATSNTSLTHLDNNSQGMNNNKNIETISESTMNNEFRGGKQ